MNKIMNYQIQDLRCCGNCSLYEVTILDYFCKQSFIHKDLIKPWFVCENWIWDLAESKKRHYI